jgi:hypothetical protein
MASREEAVRTAAGVALNAEPDDAAVALFIAEYDAQRQVSHPDEQHEFRTTCSKCGAWGQLFVAIIGPDEQALIQQIGPVDGK